MFAALVGCAIIAASWGLSTILRRDVKLVQNMPLSSAVLFELQLKLLQISQAASHLGPGQDPCEVNFDAVPDRFHVKYSVNLKAAATLPKDKDECESKLVFYGTAFVVLPKERVTVKLTKTQPSQEVVFNIMPKEAGKQAIVYGTEDKPKGATPLVFQYSWINPALSIWFPVLASLFGGMLTVPWWLRFFGIPRSKEDDDEDEDNGVKKSEKPKPKGSKKRKVPTVT